MSLKKYARIYQRFFATCLAEATSYRAHLILVIIMDLMFYLTSFLTIDFLYRWVGDVGGWQREQFMFFMAFMLCVDHFHMTFISENFWNFSMDLRTGKLDFALTKPVSALFVSFFRYIRPSTLLITPVPWAGLIYYGLQCELTFASWCLLPFLMGLAIGLLVLIELNLSMLMFITVESFGINYLRVQLQNVTRWPDFIYSDVLRRIFTFGLPLLVIGSAPVRILFAEGKVWWSFFGLIMAIGMASLVLGWSWRKGLHAYESASS